MKNGRWFAAMGALALLINVAFPIAPLDAQDIEYNPLDEQRHRAYSPEPIVSWDRDLQDALKGRSIEQAAATLAPRYGLTAADMDALVRLWLTARARTFSRPRDPAQDGALRRQLLALIASTGRAPLVLQAVAESLDALEDCSSEDFAAMLSGSSDPAADAWTIVNASPCSDNFVRAAELTPERAIPALIRLAHYGGLRAPDALPLYQWLTRPAALDRVAEADRPALTVWLHRELMRLLFETGQTDRAVSLFDALPTDLRNRVVEPVPAPFTAVVDGLPIRLDPDPRHRRLALDLAAAFALTGRTADAERLFASMPRLADARRAFDCAWEPEEDPADRQCPDQGFEQSIERLVDLLVLDHFLHQPGEDPYPLAEVGFVSRLGAETSGPVAELRCRVFTDPQFEDICADGRRSVLHAIRPATGRDEEAAAPTRVVLDALLPGFADSRATVASEFERRLAAAGGQSDSRRHPPTITPQPPPFVEAPLPAAYRGARPETAGFPREVTAPGDGFMPVRFERSGDRAVMISLSQTFDPTGEVSQGAYWIHLSRDGGRHWDPPLYTGLAEHFPYVVPSASRLPLLNGDRLDLEVEVAEIDTASITFPPIALRSRRRASDLYLQIPIADLVRDSDGDGLTDIAERNLLLDRAPSDGGTPFIVGSDGGGSCPAPAAERLALVALFDQLFSRGSGALIEPVDRPAGEENRVAGWSRARAASDRPVFIRGNPGDYACLRANRLTIVYSDADMAELTRFRPGFHAVALPRIVYNRAHDRGYVIWTAGWTGGTYRLRLVDGSWTFEVISSWIT